MLAQWVRRVTAWRLAPYSWQAFALAAACVAIAVGVRIGIGLINPLALTFASYFPAVLVAALVAGLPSGIFAILLSILSADWLFVRSDRDWPLDLLNYVFFVLVCAFIVRSARNVIGDAVPVCGLGGADASCEMCRHVAC